MKNTIATILVSSFLAATSAFAEESGYVDPAPSGVSTTEVYVYPNSTITMPGADAGTVNGNFVDFDTPGAVPEGSPDAANPDTTTIIYSDE